MIAFILFLIIGARKGFLTSMLQKKPVQNVGFVVFFTICDLTVD